MRKIIALFHTIACILILCLGFPSKAAAQGADDNTVSFVADRVVMEDDPNNRNYCFALYSPDGQWKAQINYYADEMCGTFTTEDFDLDGSGKNFNFVRNPKNDMVFYFFKEMNVTVADEGARYHINANCLASNNTRYLMEGYVVHAIPTDTIHYDLGYASITQNAFYGTYTISAENADLKLNYGIVANDYIGTFYRADLLLPELIDKHTGEPIKIINAIAHHVREDESTTRLTIDLTDEANICHSITMFNAPYTVDIVEEIDVNLGTHCVLQDLTQMYGCYQFGGQNEDYAVAIAVNPEAFESGRTEWTIEDVFMPYTNIVRLADNAFMQIHDINMRVVSTENHLLTLDADVTCRDGVLFHIKLQLELPGYVPEPKETIDIDFGRVAVLDYSQGLGVIGLGAVKPGEYQMRVYLNDHELNGEYTNDDVILDACDVMVISGDSYIFHDAMNTTATVRRHPSGRLLIDVNMLGVDTVMYHGTMYLEPLRCMKDSEYNISVEDLVTMVALLEGSDGDYSEYTVQLQDLDEVPEGERHNEGYVFSFYLGHEGKGIAGEYGYSDGTLALDEPHIFIEGGTEVRVAPMAGTLSIKPLEVTALPFGSTTYDTTLYEIEFHFVGTNGVLYEGKGENLLFCIDLDGEFITLDEGLLDHINTTLAPRGLRVRKVLDNGRMILETLDGNYELNGTRIP